MQLALKVLLDYRARPVLLGHRDYQVPRALRGQPDSPDQLVPQEQPDHRDCPVSQVLRGQPDSPDQLVPQEQPDHRDYPVSQVLRGQPDLPDLPARPA